MNGRIPRLGAVIFDMDGLVIDSERTYVTAWRHAARDVGVVMEDAFFEGLFGCQREDVTRLIAERLGASPFDPERFFMAAKDHWFKAIEAQGIQRMPGIEALLEVLQRRGLPYALATNSEARYADICLRHAGLLEAFPVRVTRDQVAAGKPAPDLFLEAAMRLGVSASVALVLEDSDTGLLAARAAGACPVLIQGRPDRFKAFAPQADRAFPSLEHFTAALLDHQEAQIFHSD
ncbi:MAG: HAD family phosphatase [Methylococcus sp.]|jgi:HAD superfamily hydrolase (TIGR01509 family)|nr:MAG: HAD family phosphatase [Methylococcus sp.]